ncbi:uncharacterized protein I303_108537 [Kwoniella dejecticola CBS 10117]|uniref:Ribosome biogenesis protein MAK21 n=1 Tax=Kwoniella dejecticola CBS 10117 TaxID=1296121 RepID=A0A1A5ZX45_9TREE|nr:ribosome biogenesis protein MAK21 [Kwoniella dejecticola CBS 10117]OBR82380.1 ribosome biogenesis protein MAK21 [Kwoniella dejecticola CBS 10117]
MAKGRGSKSTKLLNKSSGSSATAATGPNATAGPSRYSKISDELKQAVRDLGGDENDFDLIDGIDESDNDDEPAPRGVKESKKPVDEKSLKKELGDFMKGLDFGAVDVPEAESEDENEEEEDDEEEDDEEDEDQQDSEDSEEDEEASEEDEDESDESDEEDQEDEDEDEEPPVPAVQPKKITTQAADPKASTVDQDSSSATNVPASSSWTSLLPPLAPLDTPPRPITGHAFNELKQKAFNLLDNLPPLNRASSTSDQAFIAQILQSGTHQDKLSALVLLVRESPVHAMKELNRLRYMAGWKEDGTVGQGSGGNKDQRVAVIKALADWWVNGGGKPAGKLKYFADQPLLSHPQLTDRHLLVFAFEDYLKRWFFSLLQVMEVLSHDTLPFVRTQALHIIFQLLAGNAEQEQNLLRLGVNKLGDTDRSVASKASHHILQLLQAHPAMKSVVAREVSSLVLKPTGSTAAAASSGSHIKFDDEVKSKKPEEKKSDTVNHARYYGLITLNQITLTRKDTEVAGKLVDLYFEVFREILGDPKQAEEKLEAEDEEEIGEGQIEKVAGKVDKWRGRRKGTRTKNGKKTAIEQEEELIENSESKLVSAVLTGINRALPFAKLDDTMFKSYMDTLFTITHKGTFNTSIQALNLIYQVARTDSESRQAISDRYYRTLYDSLFDERLMTSSKQAMYLNLLFKSMKVDDRINRVMAFVKRLLQMLSMHQPPFICGALYLLGDLFNTTPGLKKMLIEPEDDEIEHFVDADQKDTLRPSEESGKKQPSNEREYDGKKREPLYAHADSSCLWDLVPFLTHFHPSVSLQANQLLLSHPLTGSADISLNSLVSFLDRFVYRNPKKTLQPKGASIMQPAAISDKTGSVVQNKGARSAAGASEAGLMVNSEQFWRKKVDDVPVEMMFFHKYFSKKLQRNESAKKGKGKAQESDDEDEERESAVASDEELPFDIADEEGSDEDDDEDVDLGEQDEDEDEEGSDPEEDEIWKAMKASMPGADDMALSDEDEDDMSDSDDMTEYSSDEEEGEGEGEEGESDEDEQDEVDDEEEEEEEAVPKKSLKSKGKRAASPASSNSSFPDFDDEDEDLLSESDMPNIVLGGDDSADDIPAEEDEEEERVEIGKRKRNAERRANKKKRKELPTFGSYEDYQALIEAGGEEED